MGLEHARQLYHGVDRAVEGIPFGSLLDASFSCPNAGILLKANNAMNGKKEKLAMSSWRTLL